MGDHCVSVGISQDDATTNYRWHRIVKKSVTNIDVWLVNLSRNHGKFIYLEFV